MTKLPREYLLVILLFSFSFLTAQNSFEPGYYLNAANNKVSGLIKTQDWRNSPQKIVFKASQDAQTKTISLQELNGFGITNGATYLKKNFKLNISPKRLNNLNFSKDPVFEPKTALLKLLVAGNVNLFVYENDGLKEFFYTKNGSAIKSLVYVQYLVDGNLATNEQYKQQLLNAFSDCKILSQADFLRLNYKQNALVKLVNTYNQCVDPNYTVNGKDSSKTEFTASIFGGANFSSVKIKNNEVATRGGDFGSQTSLRFGAELEALLPFNNQSWAFFAGLANNGKFQATTIQQLPSANTPEQEVTFTYASLNLPLGVRYYFNTSSNSRIGLEAGVFLDFTSEVTLDREITPNVFESTTGSQGVPFFGAGYYYKNLFLRASVDVGKDPVGKTSFVYSSVISSINVVLGYQFNLSKK